MIFLYGVPMFVGCCAILWFYLNSPKKPQKPRGHRKKKIFISGDVLLSVFQFLAPSQLGLGIALVSHRFDIIVHEQFKTRKWELKFFRIHSRKKQIQITNYHWILLPIPKIQLPLKVNAFKRITIYFIDQSVIAFLHRFRPLFAACPINLIIDTSSDRISESILRNIWPMLGKNIHGMGLSSSSFRRLRQFAPSILNDCPSLLIVKLYAFGNCFIEFPADDSATASDGQSVAKWLFAPHTNNVPKMFECFLDMDDGILASRTDALKAAFASASSPVNFIVIFWLPSPFDDFVEPFNRTNEFTGEQLALKMTDHSNRFLLIRCPIARDESKWTKWEEEAIGWDFIDQLNLIDIQIYDEDEIGDGLLDATPGPSDQQK